jgi:transposase InsO family protein
VEQRANVPKVSAKNRYVIPQRRDHTQELIIHPVIQLETGKKQTITALIDSGCTHTTIAEELVKKEKIETYPIPEPFEVYNADGTKNKTKLIKDFVPLVMENNGHTEQIDAVVSKLDEMDLFLGHDWLTYHNPEVDWKKNIIRFNRCPPECKMEHQDITFPTKIRRLLPKEDEPHGEMEKEPDPTNPEDLPHYARSFTHLFNKKKFEGLPQRREWDHEINLQETAPKELNAKAYSMTVKEEETLNTWLDEQLEAGLITESSSRYASPCFFIPKKDGTLRLVQDYRRLNEHTIKDKTPLPLINEVIDKLKDAKMFNKLDLIWGYNNVRIKEGDEWKAAFLTNKGLFEPKVMFFGMCNSPATFQRMMNSIFRPLIHDGTLANYMDDFIIPGKDEKELEERTIRFLKIAEKHNLCFKRSKCEFNATEIPILGVRVGGGHVKMEEEKVNAVRNWEIPTKVKDVESFLGFANFYRRFIKDFSHIAAPLNRLKGKEGWKWEEEEQKAFEELKKRITEEPVLSLPQKEGKFRVETDASGYAVGGVLSQEQEGKWKPIAFLSRTMTPAERNYEIYDKELLAIIEALQKWRQYLLDAKEQFEIWTDHENLKYFRDPQKLNGRQARWYLKLQDFDFIIRHIPGKANTKADILSRKNTPKEEQDNKDITLLHSSILIRRLHEEIPGPKDIILLRSSYFKKVQENLTETLQKLDIRESEFKKAIEEGKAWEENNIGYYEGRIYIPNNKELRDKILEENHSPPNIGHPGQFRMIELLKRNYWWPTMQKDVKRYVQGCQSCQQNKVIHMKKAAPLHPLPITHGPWDEISIDIIGPLPESEGHDAILVIVDRFSKMVRLFPTKTTLSSGELAKLYRDEIWKLHGIPQKIISDRGPQFASKFMGELCKALGIQRALSTAYHPQTDGQTERINQEVETFLRHYVNYGQDDWKNWLPMAEFAYNDKANSSTKHSPFYLNYGRHPWKGNLVPKSSMPELEEFLQHMEEARRTARENLDKNNSRMKTEYDKKRRPSNNFKVGEKVFLEAKNITSNRPSKKLEQRRYGPFVILEDLGKGAYKLELPIGWVIHDVFNENLLTRYHGPEFNSQHMVPPPPPEIVEGEEEYEVEELRGYRKRGRGTQYLVHWKGYGDEHDQWISKTNLTNTEELIKEYHRKFPEQNL